MEWLLLEPGERSDMAELESLQTELECRMKELSRLKMQNCKMKKEMNNLKTQMSNQQSSCCQDMNQCDESCDSNACGQCDDQFPAQDNCIGYEDNPPDMSTGPEQCGNNFSLPPESAEADFNSQPGDEFTKMMINAQSDTLMLTVWPKGQVTPLNLQIGTPSSQSQFQQSQAQCPPQDQAQCPPPPQTQCPPPPCPPQKRSNYKVPSPGNC